MTAHPDIRNPRKLTVRDLATIGIFTGIIFVVSIVVGAASGLSPVFYLFSPAVVALICGPFMLALAVRVARPGALVISFLLFGLIWAALGGLPVTICMIVAGVLAEALVATRRYQSFTMILIAYVLFCLAYFVGTFGYIAFFTEGFAASAAAAGNTAEYIDSIVETTKSGLALVALAVTAIAATGSALFGRRVLSKHFVKAGII